MSSRETLKQLAASLGISTRTAMRYLAASIDLNDRRAVEEHKLNIRGRRGVSKFNRRTLAEPARPAAIDFEDVIEDLESRLCGAHSELEFLLKQHPGLDLTDAFSYTAPVVQRITEE